MSPSQRRMTTIAIVAFLPMAPCQGSGGKTVLYLERLCNLPADSSPDFEFLTKLLNGRQRNFASLRELYSPSQAGQFWRIATELPLIKGAAESVASIRRASRLDAAYPMSARNWILFHSEMTRKDLTWQVSDTLVDLFLRRFLADEISRQDSIEGTLDRYLGLLKRHFLHAAGNSRKYIDKFSSEKQEAARARLSELGLAVPSEEDIAAHGLKLAIDTDTLSDRSIRSMHRLAQKGLRVVALGEGIPANLPPLIGFRTPDYFALSHDGQLWVIEEKTQLSDSGIIEAMEQLESATLALPNRSLNWGIATTSAKPLLTFQLSAGVIRRSSGRPLSSHANLHIHHIDFE